MILSCNTSNSEGFVCPQLQGKEFTSTFSEVHLQSRKLYPVCAACIAVLGVCVTGQSSEVNGVPSLPYSGSFPSVQPHWAQSRCFTAMGLRWERHKWSRTNVASSFSSCLSLLFLHPIPPASLCVFFNASKAIFQPFRLKPLPALPLKCRSLEFHLVDNGTSMPTGP